MSKLIVLEQLKQGLQECYRKAGELISTVAQTTLSAVEEIADTKADSVHRHQASEIEGLPSAGTGTPAAASGAGNAGASADYARADHVHPEQKDVSGKAGSADSLAGFDIGAGTDLNELKGAEYWNRIGFAEAGSACTNGPDGADGFALTVMKAGDGRTVQTLYCSGKDAMYMRRGEDAGEWGSWVPVYPQSASVTGAVPVSRTVSGKPLKTDITLGPSDVGAAASTHSHPASQITGILTAAQGGTGSGTVDTAPVSGSAKMVTSGGVYTALQSKADASALAKKQDALKFDTAPTASSTNPVTSGGILTALNAKQAKLTFDTAPKSGSSNPVTSGGILTALNGKAAASHTHAAGQITGILPTANGGTGVSTGKAPTAGTADIAKAVTVTAADAAVDFNTLTKTGVYDLPSKPTGSNAPPATRGGILRVTYMSDIKCVHQEFLQYAGKTYRRESNAGITAWEAWRAIGPVTPGDIGAAAASHTHAVSQITGILPIANGGTGVSTGKAPTAGTADVAKKLGTANLGSATQPIYLASGTATACSALVPASRTVNGKALSANIALTAADVQALPLTGGTVTGTLTLSKATDGSGTANNGPALIVGGTATGAHIEIDGNEIMAKKSGTEPEALNLNIDGGTVIVGTGGLTSKGPITGTCSTASKLGTATVGSASQPVYIAAGAATACTGVMKKPSVLTLKLTSAGWSSLAQTVTASGVVASETAQEIHVMPAAASMKNYMAAGVYCSAQAAGKLTFTCSTAPSTDLTVYATVWTL